MIRKLSVAGGAMGIVLFFAAVIILAGKLRPDVEVKPTPPVAPIVFVQPVRYAPVNLSVKTQGEVAPRREIALTAEVAGRIREVSTSFANGGVFKSGEELIKIEDADYRLAVTRAKADVASAEQRLAVEEAEAALAARDYAELSGRSPDGDASLLALRKPQLATARADLAAAKANLGDARLALERTSVIAPFDGRVRSINVNLGQYVTPGTNLGQVFSTDVAEVRLPLTDADLAKANLPFAFEAKPGTTAPPVNFYADVAGQRHTWSGTIRRVDAAIDSSTRQIAAIAEVEDPYGKGADNGFPLAFGLFVEAEIIGPTVPRATLVPLLALQNGQEVFIVDDDNKLAKAKPTIVTRDGENLVAIDGLEPGTLLVISPVTSPAGTVVRAMFENGDSASNGLDATTGSTAAAAASGSAATKRAKL